ncbi:MAG: DUF4271 domain-containing protein [Tannerella sp.]|jgi:hypothetical protein|nr:DUF4271 domain-containing protein [Tannerella sp.]
MGAEIFEGYIGIRFGHEQLIRDILFSTVFLLLICFASIFRSCLPLFIKTIKECISAKERHNLFDPAMKGNLFFRSFLKSQTLLLSTVFLYLVYINHSHINDQTVINAFITLGLFFAVTVLFYFFKQCLYLLYGRVLCEKNKYKLWNTNYDTLSYLWGISLYLPVLWLMFNNSSLKTALLLFLFSYILYRISVNYITIRIFYNKNSGVLFLSSYLCAQEITPLLFLYEGLNYLQNIIETSTLWH